MGSSDLTFFYYRADLTTLEDPDRKITEYWVSEIVVDGEKRRAIPIFTCSSPEGIGHCVAERIFGLKKQLFRAYIFRSLDENITGQPYVEISTKTNRTSADVSGASSNSDDLLRIRDACVSSLNKVLSTT